MSLLEMLAPAAPPDSLGDHERFREQEQPRRRQRDDGRHEASRLHHRRQPEEAAADGRAGDQGCGGCGAREVWSRFTAAGRAAAHGCPRTAAGCPTPRDECQWRLQGIGSQA